MINISKLPQFESLVEGMRRVKVKLPNREKALDEELRYLKVMDGKYIVGEKVSNNDIVKLKVQSSLEKFNKDNIDLVVGRNYLNEDLEKAIVGLSINESKSIKIDDIDVEVVVLDIKSKVYGELTLDRVREQNPEISSVEEFENGIYENICNQLILEKASNLLILPVIRKLKSQIEIKCELEDVNEDYRDGAYKGIGEFKTDESYKLVRYVLNEDDKYITAPEGSDRKAYFDSLNEDEVKKAYDEYVVNKFKHESLCLEFGKNLGIDFSESAYEKEVENIAKRYNYDKEFIKERYPYDAFRYGKAESKVNDFLFDYFKKNNIEIVSA